MISKRKLNDFFRKFNFEIHGTGYLQSLKKGEFKSNEFEYFQRAFGNRAITIFDVGANRGLKTKEFIKHFPGAELHAFEPYQPLFAELESQFSGLKNIHLHNLGISSQPGQKIFNVNRGIDTSSFLTSKHTGLSSDAQVATLSQVLLRLTTMEKVVEERKISRIHILKLDIQGSELDALKGAQRLLKEKKIDLIFTEAYFVEQYVDQPLFYDIASYLKQYDYFLQDIYNPIYGKNRLAWCDAVFIRNNLND